MSSLALSRSSLRAVSTTLAIVILLEASPVAVMAATAPSPAALLDRAVVRASLAQLATQLHGDLKLLADKGKEAYLDVLFARLAADEVRAREVVARAVKSFGPRPLGSKILGLGCTILANVLSVIPESWQEAIVISTLNTFIARTLTEVRGVLAGQTPAALAQGLKALLRLVSDPRFADGQALTGDSWWEDFFGNSTVVRNFLIVIVTLSAVGVAVGLAIAGSTVAPVVAVIGALVALIALMNA